MALSEDNISPEEKLLKVIKGGSSPIPPRVNPFAGSGPVVPPLSDVLASIIGSGSRTSKAPVPVVVAPEVGGQRSEVGRQGTEVKTSAPVAVPATKGSDLQSVQAMLNAPLPVLQEPQFPLQVTPLPVVEISQVPVVPTVSKILELINSQSVLSAPLPAIQEPVVPLPVTPLPVEPLSVIPVLEVSPPVTMAEEPEDRSQKTAVTSREESVSEPVAIASADIVEVISTPVAVSIPVPVMQEPGPEAEDSSQKSDVSGQPAPQVAPEPVPEPVVMPAAVPVAQTPEDRSQRAEDGSQKSDVSGQPPPVVSSPAPVRVKPRPVAAPVDRGQRAEGRDQKPEVRGQKLAVPVAAVPPARPVVPSTRPVPLPVVEEKSKLRVAKAEVPVVASAKIEAPAPAPVKVDKKQLQDMAKTKAALVEDSVEHVIPPIVIIAKKSVEKKRFGINNVNIGLAVAALLLIAVSVNEIFAKMKNDELLRQPFGPAGQASATQNAPGGGGNLQVPPLEMLVQGLGDRPILAMPGQKAKEAPASTNAASEQAPQMVDWMKYVQDSIKLMGFSGAAPGAMPEAIIQEGKDKDTKLHFLKAGQKMTVQGQEITIESIKDDQVFMTDGKRKMTVR